MPSGAKKYTFSLKKGRKKYISIDFDERMD